MKKILILSLFLILVNCSKPKTVLICGDHICVNKQEAQEFFEKNLTLEVKIIDKTDPENIDLVELNLNPNKDMKEVNVFKKKETRKKIKVLSKEEIKIKKSQLKARKTINKNKQKIKEKAFKDKNIEKTKINKVKKTKKKINNQDKPQLQIVDICEVLEKCDIEEISKYLTKQGKNKKFPDITTRE